METFKPIIPFRGRAALLATACLITPLLGGEPRGSAGIAAAEQSRRSAAIDEAQELLRKGDEAYLAARYGEAAEAYSGARELIPDAPVSADLRSAATERYAQASVEQARVLSRKGDVAAAKAAVDKILIPSVDPQNVEALAFRNQLDDPIRTNPALTAEHAKDVDAVRRLLYTAEGAFNLGDFDRAITEYKNVLRIDPTNTAARRGMEKVTSAKSDYHKSSHDHARAEMLSQVDAAWETQIPAPELDASMTDPVAATSDADVVYISAKLDRIIIPKLSMEQTSLEEAIEFLRIKAAENDTTELDSAKKGVNITVNLGPQDSPVAKKIRSLRFDLQLSQVPLGQALKYITDMTQTSFTTDDFSVILTPAGSSSAELVRRTYRVPPDFISNLNTTDGASSGTTVAAADPFSSAPEQTGLLAVRMGAQEALAKQGVSFPDGASANYNASNNLLNVVNTATNQEYISQIIESITQTEPVIVSVRVTMIKVEETYLEELGFDFLLDDFGGGDAFLSGGTQGSGSAIGEIPNTPGPAVSNPITSGNRSGDGAISGNSIDSLISAQSGRQTNSRAPGILGVRGQLSNGAVQSLMRGLNQKKGVDMMAKPSIHTRSGQASSFLAVRDFIYPTEYEPPEIPNSVSDTGGSTTPVTPATPTAFATKQVGITLEVLPVADANKQYIDVTLNPVVSDFDGFVNYGSPILTTTQGILGTQTAVITPNAILQPIFSKKSLSNNVRIADGATIVVGGLLQEGVENVIDKTPILGDIPIIGRLFQSSARKKTSTAIIFLVNVELMDPTGRPYRNK